MKKKSLSIILACCILAAGCGKADVGEIKKEGAFVSESSTDGAWSSNIPASDKDSSKQEDTEEDVQSSAGEDAQPKADDTETNNNEAAESGDVLSESELSSYTDMFNDIKLNGFLKKPFNNGTEVDWNEVFKLGAGIGKSDASEEEKADFLKQSGYTKINDDFMGLTGTDIQSFVNKYTETDYADAQYKLNDHWDYLEKYDTYYAQYLESTACKYKCIEGKADCDKISLRFTVENKDEMRGINPDRILTMKKQGADFVMLTNEFLWDEGADESQTFEVEMTQFERPAKFYTYLNEETGYPMSALVYDGKEITISSYYLTDNRIAKDVTAVGFFDYNADGKTDIIKIGTTEDGEDYVILERSNNNEEYFDRDFALEDVIAGSMTSPFSIAGVQMTLLGNNPDAYYGDYKSAYVHIVNLFEMQGNYKYDLIYVDDDDIPELVVDAPGYNMNMYTYENGHVNCMMDGWGYGAMGNTGYEYVPRKNCIFNHNQDYAGAVHKEYYMSKREGAEIETDYSIRLNFFEDVDGDGYPSEEELALHDELIEGDTAYYCYTGEDLTEEEIRNRISEMSAGTMEEITGTMDGPTVLGQLLN